MESITRETTHVAGVPVLNGVLRGVLLGVAASEGVYVRLNCVGDAVSEAGVEVTLGVPDGVGTRVHERTTKPGPLLGAAAGLMYSGSVADAPRRAIETTEVSAGAHEVPPPDGAVLLVEPAPPRQPPPPPPHEPPPDHAAAPEGT